MAAEISIPMIQTRPNPTVSLLYLPSMWTEFQHFCEHILERNRSTLRVERGL